MRAGGPKLTKTIETITPQQYVPFDIRHRHGPGRFKKVDVVVVSIAFYAEKICNPDPNPNPNTRAYLPKFPTDIMRDFINLMLF